MPLWKVPGVRRVSPLLIQYASAEIDGAKKIVQVVGSDLIQMGKFQNRALPYELSQEAQTGISKIPVNQLAIIVAGQKRIINILNPEGNSNSVLDSFGGQTILLDIAHFQELFNRVGKINKIAVTYESEVGDIDEKIKSSLPSGLSVTKNQISELDNLTDAFRLNLNFLSFLSLLVSSLLIFNAVSFITLQRQGELSILRLIGGSPAQIRSLLLFEAGIIGLFASSIGILLGSFISTALVAQVSRSIGNLYHPTSTPISEISFDILLTSLVLGTVMSILGSLPPAIHGGRVKFQEIRKIGKSKVKLSFLLGLLVLGLTYVSTQIFSNTSIPYFGFIPPGLLTLSFLFFAPAITECSFFISRKFETFFGIELAIGRSFLEVSPRRVFSTISAVGLALGLFLGVSSMVESFRGSVQNWLGNILKADIYFSAQESITGVSPTGLPEKLIQVLEKHPSIKKIEKISSRLVKVDGLKTLVYGTDFKTIFTEQRLQFLSVDTELSLQKDIAVVSENYLRRHGPQPEILIPTAFGVKNIQIAGVFRDYSSEQGVIYLPKENFQFLFNQHNIQAASIYLQNNSEAQQVIEDVREMTPELTYVSRSNKELKSEVLRVFDQTFTITYALEAISLIVSLFVIINTVLMLSVERSRDLALLNAIGASSKQRFKIFFYESSLLGLTGGVSGVLQGFFLSLILVFFVNRYFFGWSIMYEFNFLLPCLTLLVVSLLAGAFGALASKLSPPSVAGLKYE
jgi:putative ABC transport system permease protein